jgi:hypothetical protein
VEAAQIELPEKSIRHYGRYDRYRRYVLAWKEEPEIDFHFSPQRPQFLMFRLALMQQVNRQHNINRK